MVATIKKLQAKRAAQEIDGGFTLIELLIVIVVLGILAAVVVFSLGGVTTSSALAACQSDGATYETALAAATAQGTPIADAGSYTGAPTTLNAALSSYISTAPGNSTHYQFAIKSGVLYVGLPAITTAPPAAAGATAPFWVQWSGSSACTTTGANPTVK